MVDFFTIATRATKRGSIEIYPKFIVRNSNDLMIRGGDFYAVWCADKGLWSTDEQDLIDLVDNELDKFYNDHKNEYEGARVLHMWDAETRVIASWHQYVKNDMRDRFHMLDEKLVFSNDPVRKQDYASKRLPYPLEEGSIEAFDKLIGTLYSSAERHKIEWAIGSIVSGYSKKLQKFFVLYGSGGTGKSTILNIIMKMFEGYYCTFDAKALGSSNNSFALEDFKTNPLVAIQHDGDLSRIEDNTRLNSLVSHELMTVNEKFKSTYQNKFKCLLFMGTNKPVKITDAKSGLIRRLIDVAPTGNLLSRSEYDRLMKQIEFELGAIACHCREVFLENPNYYDDYIPTVMLDASNDFYNFISEYYYTFKKDDSTTLKQAWKLYCEYCDDAKVQYPYAQRAFKEELKNYFWDYKERYTKTDGTRVRNYYDRFRFNRFESENNSDKKELDEPEAHKWIELSEQKSILDELYFDCPAQYASLQGTPIKAWAEVKGKLKDLDTSRLHYVMPPKNHIFIDFDIKDENGNKCLEKNIEAANKWPPTYAELSKGGQGLHLHYIYTGDVSLLDDQYDESIEIKTLPGNSSLRRKLSKCNDLTIATISSGLPLKKKEQKMVNEVIIKNEKMLANRIKKCLNREYHPNTKPNVDYIYKSLEEAYNSGMVYDLSNYFDPVFKFASQSTNQSQQCLKLVSKMHFKSDTEEDNKDFTEEKPIAFFDCEVFPNLLLINYKERGEDKPVIRMINPSPEEVQDLVVSYRLIGFNNLKYDNLILYARIQGCDNMQIYKLSQKIILDKEKSAYSREAKKISYTDILDFSSKKQSLKKFEIELGFHHKELGLPWDKPVPEEMWETVAEYCDNDVLATEKVFEARQADFTARKILADVAGMTVNDTTNALTTRIIFGNNRNPQDEFNYRDLGDMSAISESFTITEDMQMYTNYGDEYTKFDSLGRPIFPGYVYDSGKSIYRGEEVGEGGYVYSEPGMYYNVALLDIASMHPSSIIAEDLFGPTYTKRFREIRDARIAIKHKDFEKAGKMLDGKLAKYLTDEKVAKDLAQALKIAINSVYGLTSARFMNAFKDIRNKDNIVAKRGALFMVNLKYEVQKRGFTVAHIKTDSIKIPNATPEIIQFVMDYGKMYGYNFEHEATYEKMCLVNKSTYIAKELGWEEDEDLVETNGWTATGTQFQVPYVFKTLFSHQDVEFSDLCETKQVTSALYLDMNETLGEDEHDFTFIGKTGLFCPIRPGLGGGILLREAVDKQGDVKYDSAVGTTGYRWLEAEYVQENNLQFAIDKSYYNNLVDEAIKEISKFGDFYSFADKIN